MDSGRPRLRKKKDEAPHCRLAYRRRCRAVHVTIQGGKVHGQSTVVKHLTAKLHLSIYLPCKTAALPPSINSPNADARVFPTKQI
jgi:hypothetical protein